MLTRAMVLLAAARTASAFLPRRLATARSRALSVVGKQGLADGSDGIELYSSQAIAEGETPALTLFFLHGLGDTANGWAGAFAGQGVDVPGESYKVVLPTAATVPVTLNGGMAMPSWFDLYGLDAADPVDEPGIDAAAARLLALAEREADDTKVVFGGFSQGGAVALTAGLRADFDVEGIVGASTWLPLAETYPAKLAAGAAARPVGLFHGSEDLTVRTAWGEETRDVLAGLGFDVAWHAYAGMAHSACEAEFADMAAFLRKVASE